MFGFGKKKATIVSPCAGNVVALDQVNDPTFAGKIVGDGFAILPELTGVVDFCSPVKGEIKQVFNSAHAFTIVAKDGLEVLVHIGLDTKHLEGSGFEALVAQGDSVEAGTPIVRVDVESLLAKGVDLTTPVVFPNKLAVKEVMVTTRKTVAAAAAIAEVVHA